ncbi:hypothetical protein XENOCAPTIV_019966 [Xenoophorus captivus]|uniref:Uncharacterized protein n=1 Tax=Xenoophorus captivus TaxID=1517983 RepID=A0ABV0SG72_9TELE
MEQTLTIKTCAAGLGPVAFYLKTEKRGRPIFHLQKVDSFLDSGRPWRLNNAQQVIKGLKYANKLFPRPLHYHHRAPLIQGRNKCCLFPKFWPNHMNVADEVETQSHQAI